jgi:hypothetical protein
VVPLSLAAAEALRSRKARPTVAGTIQRRGHDDGFDLGLTSSEKNDLVEYLKSLPD